MLNYAAADFTTGALAAVGLLLLTSYAIRWRKGTFHLWRWHAGYFQPHWSVGWSIFELLLVALNCAATYWEVQRARGIAQPIWQNFVLCVLAHHSADVLR